jgi:hypothetical protein
MWERKEALGRRSYGPTVATIREELRVLRRERDQLEDRLRALLGQEAASSV